MPVFPRELAVVPGSTFTRTVGDSMPSMITSQNWEDFNYPPLLNLWHYAPHELEAGPRIVARTLHAALLLALLALACNLLVNLGVVVAGFSHAIYIMYGLFNLLLGMLIGMWTTMACGYKGMASNKPKLMRRYLWVWGLLTLGMAVASLLSLINFNGWARVASLVARPADPAIQLFWLVGSVIESSVWTLACVVSAVAWTMIFRANRDGPAALRWYAGGRR
mmetsp:Transcript_18207/g.37080  ORF Transcript_18207/g.37080 Transcript_18207/m.37080 type:complete len:221 (+) Transcript_18207:68-730(+)